MSAAADDPILRDPGEAESTQSVEGSDCLGTSEAGRVADVVRDYRALVAADPVNAPLPSHIGAYRIIGRIGRGAMGEVYEAEQAHPRRAVALKVILPHLINAAMLRRFKVESEVLGRLDHPGIAGIYEAGITEHVGGAPLPYFAMELVRGKPLTTFSDDQGLSAFARLELLAKVADAVHHAHQKFIIHRDLKPANILVGADGQPKVLDFGVARVTDADIQAVTIETDPGSIVGTLQYMSPEQAGGSSRDLDLRSDVYALGIIAYELLARRLPYLLKGNNLSEAVRVIQQVEPSRLRSINRSLPSDVETIVVKALEKDKDRRYESAAEFAADIRRFLRREPISARPPTVWYQVATFARRNRTLVAAIAATFAVLVAGIVVTTVFMYHLGRARNSAESAVTVARQERERSIHFAAELNQLVGRLDPWQPQNEQAAAERLLDELAAEVGKTQPSDGPEFLQMRAGLLNRIGRIYDNMDRPLKAIACLTQARDLRRRLSPLPELDIAETLNYLAWAQSRTGRYTEAVASAKGSYEIRQRLLGDSNPDTIVALSDYSRMQAFAGNPGIRDRLFLMAMLTATGQIPTDENIEARYGELTKLALRIDKLSQGHSKEGEAEAERLLRDYVKPYQSMPAIALRLPWVVSQFGQYLKEEKKLSAAGLALAQLGYKLATEHPNHPDLQLTKQLVEKMQADEATAK
jgi:serine/threonine protein kinase